MYTMSQKVFVNFDAGGALLRSRASLARYFQCHTPVSLGASARKLSFQPSLIISSLTVGSQTQRVQIYHLLLYPSLQCLVPCSSQWQQHELLLSALKPFAPLRHDTPSSPSIAPHHFSLRHYPSRLLPRRRYATYPTVSSTPRQLCGFRL